LVVALDPSTGIREGSRATLWFDSTRMHLFEPKSGDNLTRDVVRTSRAASPAQHRQDDSSAEAAAERSESI
jgi:multiple sugar transport system ATP-binding protein